MAVNFPPIKTRPLLPVFSLPVRATASVANITATADAGSGDTEPVNPPPNIWESAWTKLSVAVEEWETATRAGNEPTALLTDDKEIKKTADKSVPVDTQNPKITVER